MAALPYGITMAPQTAMQRAGALPRGVWRLALVACLVWLAACAQPVVKPAGVENAWSGRLALQVEGQAEQSFSALFELQGTPEAGEFFLISPLGNRIAELTWRDGEARLVHANESRSARSLDALLEDVTGTQIPITALFSWLKGESMAVPGWTADLSGVADGRLLAHRSVPAPPATLRVALVR